MYCTFISLLNASTVVALFLVFLSSSISNSKLILVAPSRFINTNFNNTVLIGFLNSDLSFKPLNTALASFTVIVNINPSKELYDIHSILVALSIISYRAFSYFFLSSLISLYFSGLRRAKPPYCIFFIYILQYFPKTYKNGILFQKK